MSKRLNARIDGEVERKVKYLCRRTGQTTTEVIKASIDAYYDRISPSSAEELLAPFIGCGEGTSRLSKNYKVLLRDSLGQKVRG
jgi:hypothetical protein